MGNFVSLQKQELQKITEQTNASNRITITVLSVSGALILTAAVLLAWRITISITLPLQTALEATTRVASGDLVSEIEIEGSDEAAQMLMGMQTMRNGLASMVNEVRSCAESITTGAHEISMGNTNLSQRTESQASSLEETAASMEELSSTVKAMRRQQKKPISSQARQAMQLRMVALWLVKWLRPWMILPLRPEKSLTSSALSMESLFKRISLP